MEKKSEERGGEKIVCKSVYMGDSGRHRIDCYSFTEHDKIPRDTSQVSLERLIDDTRSGKRSDIFHCVSFISS